jgi:DHA1 family multidrug resistance protein-like MFS transporter
VATTRPREAAGFGRGLLQTSVFVGSSGGPLLGGLISDFFGIHAALFATPALLLFAGLIVLKFVSEDFTPPPRGGFSLRSVIPDFSPLRESRELPILVLAVAIVQISNSVVTPILPLVIQAMTPESVLVGSTTGLVLGAGALAAALASAGIGRVSFKFGYRRTLISCMVGAALFAIPQGLSTTPTQLLLLRIAGGVFLGGTMPSINAMIALRTDKGRQGSIYGLTASVGSGGMALGPVIGAGVSAAFGFPAAFFSMTIMLLSGTAFIIFLTKTVQRRGEKSL